MAGDTALLGQMGIFRPELEALIPGQARDGSDLLADACDSKCHKGILSSLKELIITYDYFRANQWPYA